MTDPSALWVGVDEAGTGSWICGFSVGVYAIRVCDLPLLEQIRVTDSKKLSDEKRRALLEDLATVGRYAATVVTTVEEANPGNMKNAWRFSILQLLAPLLENRRQIARLWIDGNVDAPLRRYLLQQWQLDARFEPKADANHKVVGAASVFAKTARDDHVRVLHPLFPHYGWDRNAGYGTPDHQAAIAIHGVCEHHRRIGPLQKYQVSKTSP